VVGWEEDQGDVREAVHIEAHKDPLVVSGDVCGSVVKEQDDVAQLSLHLGVDPRRHETLKQTQLKLVGFVDVYQG
jgi:hypothetical protein